MMNLRTFSAVLAVAVAASLAPTTEAHAAFGVFNFESVLDSAGDLPAGGNLVFTDNARDNVDGTLAGGADIVIGRVDYQPGATPTSSTPYSVDFQYTVTLTDQDSGLSGDVVVSGTFTGNYIGGASAAINAQLLGTYAVNPTSVDLGGTTYLVSTAQSSGPGSVDDPGVLRINVQAVPEPGSLALAGIGLVGLMGLRWRRRLQTV